MWDARDDIIKYTSTRDGREKLLIVLVLMNSPLYLLYGFTWLISFAFFPSFSVMLLLLFAFMVARW